MTDHVFGGMTRPATVGGVPQIIFGVVLIATILSIIIPVMFKASFFYSIGGVGFGILTYMTARILCEKDPNTFEYLKVWFYFRLAAGGRKVGRGMVTFSKFPLRKR